MQKEKNYNRVKFSPEVIEKAWAKIGTNLNNEDKEKRPIRLMVQLKNEKWYYDNESEFFSDYMKECVCANYMKNSSYGKYVIELFYIYPDTRISIEAPTREIIEDAFQVFEQNKLTCALPDEKESDVKKPVIFIGHGQSDQWRDLKDHLQDKHDYDVEAYEIGERAGHTIRDILEQMLSKSTFAILVMTGEDKDEQGNLKARDNVIHELGLFQGKLGFSRAVVLLEEGTKEFSNIHGIQQIRYSKNNIKETFGDVLAVLKREFGE